MPPDAATPARVEVLGVTRSFPGVAAVQDASVRVVAGTVHAVVGENGAGKSTLLRILAGLLRPDAGEIRVDGARVQFRSPADAIGLGIGMVHQHLQLADNLTVLENTMLGAEPTRRGRLDLDAAARRIVSVGERHGLPLDPRARVGDLSIGARQRVELVRVLARGARILLLDEPTAQLVPQEAAELLAALRRMRDAGITVLFVSHRLDEVLAVADEVTVMRAGRTLDAVPATQTDARALAVRMIGAELPVPPSRTEARIGGQAVAIRQLSVAGPDGRPRLRDVSLEVRAGEIVGLAGVEGNGQDDLVEALVGLVRPTAGTVALMGQDVTGRSVRDRRRLGLAVIPGDRRRDGLLLDAPLWENRVLGRQAMAPFCRGGWLTRRRARAAAKALVAAAEVRTPSVDVAAGALSGGNQQKLVVARELADAPRVLIAAHPTRGVDVGARASIHARLVAARDASVAVLLLSSDLDELIGLADRIVVLLRGAIVAELTPGSVTPETLGAAMSGIAGESTASELTAGRPDDDPVPRRP